MLRVLLRCVMRWESGKKMLSISSCSKQKKQNQRNNFNDDKLSLSYLIADFFWHSNAGLWGKPHWHLCFELIACVDISNHDWPGWGDPGPIVVGSCLNFAQSPREQACQDSITPATGTVPTILLNLVPDMTLSVRWSLDQAHWSCVMMSM